MRFRPVERRNGEAASNLDAETDGPFLLGILAESQENPSREQHDGQEGRYRGAAGEEIRDDTPGQEMEEPDPEREQAYQTVIADYRTGPEYRDGEWETEEYRQDDRRQPRLLDAKLPCGCEKNHRPPQPEAEPLDGVGPSGGEEAQEHEGKRIRAMIVPVTHYTATTGASYTANRASACIQDGPIL